MLRLGLLVAAIAVSFQPIPICRPLKEDDAYILKTSTTVDVGQKRTVDDQLIEHKCLVVDEHGVEHIEAKCIGGTTKVGDKEPESAKGETYNYFQNAHGQRFEYEDIRVNLKEDPVEYVVAEIHAKLKDFSVVPDETWRDTSANTTYTITVGQPKQYMKTECIEVIRKGTFTKGITGQFKEDTWYRTSDGQLMSQVTIADEVTIPEIPIIQFIERLEFQPEKT